MGKSQYTVGEFLNLFDEDIADEGNMILWEKIKPEFENTYFPINPQKIINQLLKCCLELTGEPLIGYHPIINTPYYIDADFWTEQMFPNICANIDAMNIAEEEEEHFGKLDIKIAKRRMNVGTVDIPKGALYGTTEDGHFFVLKDYLQFSRFEEFYWVILSSSKYDYIWEYPFFSNSVFLNKIIDFIDMNELYDQKVEDSTIKEVLREDSRRGKIQSYKNIKATYYEKKWFYRV